MRAVAYSTVVRPMLEYSSTFWDPHQNSDIHNLKQVQCRANTLFTKTTQNEPLVITKILTWFRVLGGSLSWSLDITQKDHLILFSVQHGLVDMTISGPQIRVCNWKIAFLFNNKTHVVVTQKNHLNESRTNLQTTFRDENSRPFSIRKISKLILNGAKQIFLSLIKSLDSQNTNRRFYCDILPVL